jgi:hypothetical protein
MRCTIVYNVKVPPERSQQLTQNIAHECGGRVLPASLGDRSNRNGYFALERVGVVEVPSDRLEDLEDAVDAALPEVYTYSY